MNEQDAPPIWFFILWLCLVPVSIYLNFYMDGWRRLSKHYQTSQPASGKRWTLQRATVGWTRFSHTLILTTNMEGMFLEVFVLVRFRRKRLFIPWQDFHNASVKYYILWRDLVVEVGEPRITKLRLSPEVFEHSEGRKLLESPIGTNVPTP